MHDPSWNRVTLVGLKGYRFILQINQKPALEDKEELVFLIVFVPMEFSLHHTQANDTVIHLTKRLVVPLLLAGSNEARYVNQLQETELGVKLDGVITLFFHKRRLFQHEGQVDRLAVGDDGGASGEAAGRAGVDGDGIADETDAGLGDGDGVRERDDGRGGQDA
jgi:hypothetical protein